MFRLLVLVILTLWIGVTAILLTYLLTYLHSTYKCYNFPLMPSNWSGGDQHM